VQLPENIFFLISNPEESVGQGPIGNTVPVPVFEKPGGIPGEFTPLSPASVISRLSPPNFSISNKVPLS
jgi:hypothetical protein